MQRGVQKGKIDPVCKNQGPPEEKKRPHPQKSLEIPTKIRPNFYLYRGQILHEMHIVKFVAWAAQYVTDLNFSDSDTP